MKSRKRWEMEWVAFIPNVGHVLIQYKDGHLVGPMKEILDARHR